MPNDSTPPTSMHLTVLSGFKLILIDTFHLELKFKGVRKKILKKNKNRIQLVGALHFLLTLINCEYYFNDEEL